MKSIKAVIFDLDDTLIDRALTFYQYSHAFIRERFTSGELPDTIDNMLQYMIALDNNGHCNKYEFYGSLIEKWKMKNCTQQQLRDSYIENFQKYTTPYEDTKMVLEYLAPNYKLGIITNGSSKVQNGKIDSAKIREFFTSIIIGEDVGLYKPDKQVFLLACNTLEVEPGEAVYVGDYYIKDVVGARNAGLEAIWYPNGANADQPYDCVINRLSEMKNIL